MSSGKILRPLPKPGARNSHLTVLRLVGRTGNKSNLWLVECDLCQSTFTQSSVLWRRNKTGMCHECALTRDMLGKRFGKLTVLECLGVNDAGNRVWLCRCDCGRTTTAQTSPLRRGEVKSCGCLKRRMDLEGKRFGKLTVIGMHGISPRSGSVTWDCVCDCGNRTVEEACRLNSRPGVGVRSCGCDGRRRIPRDDQKLYSKWSWMMKHEHAPSWNDYGTFRAWAKRSGYTNRCTLARVDNTKPYTPPNCFWLDGRLRGITGAPRPSNWKPVTVYRDGALFGWYQSLTAAAQDLVEEEPERSAQTIMRGLRNQAKGRCKSPYLGRWTARYEKAFRPDGLTPVD